MLDPEATTARLANIERGVARVCEEPACKPTEHEARAAGRREHRVLQVAATTARARGGRLARLLAHARHERRVLCGALGLEQARDGVPAILWRERALGRQGPEELVPPRTGLIEQARHGVVEVGQFGY